MSCSLVEDCHPIHAPTKMLGEACAALPLQKLQLDFSKCQALRRHHAAGSLREVSC